MADALPTVVPAREARHEPFALTDQQHAYLVGRSGEFELGNVSTHAYYEYEGTLDMERFTLAWRRVIDRHDMLRAVLDPETQTQRILADVPPFEPELLDLRGLGAGEVAARLDEVRERLSHEVRAPEVYPVFAVVVSRLDDERARVHISFDGITLDYLSWQLLVADLTRFYDDPELDVPPLELTFRDYLRAQEEATSSEAYRRAERYWSERAAELPPSPRLPMRAEPASIDRPRWTSRAGGLDAGRWSSLKAAAGRAGLTPTALMLGAFAEVLAVWSEAPRFTVNVPRMNRLPLHPQANEILGEFASFSLLEVNHDGDAPFAQRAKAIQRQLWSDLAHLQVTGVRVLRELIKAHGGFQRALMPVVLTSTLGFTAGERPLLGGRLDRVFAISQTPQVYLDVQIEESEGALVYNWDRVDDVFPDGLIEQACAAFGALLERLADDAAAWEATDLALVPAAHASAGGIAGPVRAVPPVLVQDLFAAQVAKRPGDTALITTQGTITYEELFSQANRIGHWLRDGGCDRETPVAVLMDKGAEQVAAAYGALFAGAPYVPIDASLPPARVTRLLEQAGVRQVLTQPQVNARLAEAIGNEREVLEVGAAALAELPDTALDAVRRPDDLAYVLFTSGSTGTPKAVMIQHEGMVNCLKETITTFGLDSSDRSLAVTALHHDMSTFDIFGMLAAGGSVVIPDAEKARDPRHWAELVSGHGVTVWNSVPAMMEMLLEQTEDDSGVPAGLRLAFLGGDWIPLHVPRTLTGLGVRVVSVGGPTETTLWNIWHPVERVEDGWRSVPYGKPIANTRYYLFDQWLRDRPEGVTGELYCAGPGVARGYLGDQERTDAAFVRHPRTGERLYRTGDLGRCLPGSGGVIEFAGRADGQVKIRGQRIELGEIESVLAACPGVRAAVVTPDRHTDRPGYRALVGHVTGDVDAAELRAALRAQLPEHMVPGSLLVHERFPLTGNGKVDRTALAELTDSSGPVVASAGYEAPATALEEVIAEAWGEVLEAEKVGVHDDFFALGGDSVRATRIVVRLREALDQPELKLLTLLSTVTVRQLAEALAEEQPVPGRIEQVAEIYLQIARMSDEDLAEELSRG